MFLAFSLANPTIMGRRENTSLMQSIQDFSTSLRSKYIFLSFRASCCPSIPWFSWNNRNLLLLISNRLINTAHISASSVPSRHLLHSTISVSIPRSQGLVNPSLACSFSCCFLCAWSRSSLFSRRFICDSLATKSTRNRWCPVRQSSCWALLAFLWWVFGFFSKMLSCLCWIPSGVTFFSSSHQSLSRSFSSVLSFVLPPLLSDTILVLSSVFHAAFRLWTSWQVFLNNRDNQN